MSFYYMASPYSRYEQGVEAAFEEACRQAAFLLQSGIPVFSPIAMTHPIALHGDINPYDCGFWIAADKPLMEAAAGLIVCKLEGWDESQGVAIEISEFQLAGKPIHYMTPFMLPDGMEVEV